MASQEFSPLVKIWSQIPVRAIFVDPEHYLLMPNDEYLELSNGVLVTKLPTHVVKDCSANRWQVRECTFSLSESRREIQREITFANGQRYRCSSRAWIVAPFGSSDSGLTNGGAANAEWEFEGQCLVVVENRGPGNPDHLLVIPESEAGMFGEHNSWDAVWMMCSNRRVVVDLRGSLGPGEHVKVVCEYDPLTGFCDFVVSSVL
ncbi:hypothetical protein NMY22_g16074 [Coprinellus aureogranulatus]|nr:hypothetical protein NMY22_g16074 [Coprinellus aureogranulatus]